MSAKTSVKVNPALLALALVGSVNGVQRHPTEYHYPPPVKIEYTKEFDNFDMDEFLSNLKRIESTKKEVMELFDKNANVIDYIKINSEFFVPTPEIVKLAVEKKDTRLLGYLFENFPQSVHPDMLNVDLDYLVSNIKMTQHYMWPVVLHPYYVDWVEPKPQLKLYLKTHDLLVTKKNLKKLLDHDNVDTSDIETLLEHVKFTEKEYRIIKSHKKFRSYLNRHLPIKERTHPPYRLEKFIKEFFGSRKITKDMIRDPMVKEWLEYRGIYYTAIMNNEALFDIILETVKEPSDDLLPFLTLSANKELRKKVRERFPSKYWKKLDLEKALSMVSFASKKGFIDDGYRDLLLNPKAHEEL